MQDHPFADLPASPESHFTLHFYAAVVHVTTHVFRTFATPEEAVEQFPFLAGYCNELASHGLNGRKVNEAGMWWQKTLDSWEDQVAGHLPIRALQRSAGLDHAAMTLFFSIGLPEVDPRFGVLFGAMRRAPDQRRPHIGLLYGWWRDLFTDTEFRHVLRRLQELGLIRFAQPDAPTMEREVQVNNVLWDSIRGDVQDSPTTWCRYQGSAQLLSIENLIVSDEVRHVLQTVPTLLQSGEAKTLVIRGPQHNGRRTVLGAVAKTLGCGVLAIDVSRLNPSYLLEDDRWKVIGPLATLLHAIPVIILDLASGETADFPPLLGYDGPLGIVVGKQGGLSGAVSERALRINLDMPGPSLRSQHWVSAFGLHAVPDLEEISDRMRMTSGNIRRAAGLGPSYAALESRPVITIADVQQAARALNRHELETLATPVAVSGDWNHLAVGMETQRELEMLESRCRHRERLHCAVGPALHGQLNPGVRALFSGPSGTGKTLAARLLASALQMDLYRLDLSVVVNKYIGETEKNLSQIFARAEELDVILLLDEGDALLTRRTNVHTSNDRYANLETNFLLQRFESYTGILLVTTNAGDRIDSAFQRRMDMVVHFRPAEASERWTIWQMHLPANHTVPDSYMQEMAQRCTFNGGQIRNAALHAALLALNNGGIIATSYLEEAIRHEYQKSGAVCPLRAKSG